MNRDNFLFATIGLLVGFITGYLLHEVMVARQPLRRLPGEMAAVTAAPGDAGGPMQPGGAGDPAAGAAGGVQGDARIDPGAGPAGGGAEAGGGGGVGGGGSASPAGGQPGTGAQPGMAAVQQLRDHVASHPNDADAVLKLANLNFDIRNWGRARDLYSHYLTLRKPDADVLTDLGNCYRGVQQYDDALAQFRRAEQLAPDHWKALFSEVVVLGFDLKRWDDAGKALARLQAVAPQQPEVQQLAAALAQRRAGG